MYLAFATHGVRKHAFYKQLSWRDDFLYGHVIAFKRAHRWFDVKDVQFEGAQ